MMKKVLTLIFSGLLLFNLSGCVWLVAGAAGGVGTAFWLSDKLSETVSVPFKKSIRAVESALNSLKLEVTKKTVKGDVAQFISHYTDGKTIWIDVRPVTETSSKIEVRVGATGDEAASRKIMDRILKYL